VKAKIFIEYLETLVLDDDCTDDEYGLYLEYKEHGRDVFNEPKNRLLCNKIIRNSKEIYNTEG